jgi:NADH:ubiquinone oxidoreductase subunit
MSIGTKLFTYFRGQLVGSDDFGNRYFTERARRPDALRQRRWVMFKGAEEASAVPPEWHAWLHYTTDAPISMEGRKSWQKPHLPNLTGTAAGYRPSGHDYEGGRRAATTGDYEAWTPGS